MDITQILDELRHQRSRLDSAISALEGGQTAPRRGRPPKAAQAASAPVAGTPKRGPRKMSAAARAKIAAAQRLRWAKQKGEASPQKESAAPKKRKSAAKKASGRKPMSPAMKKKLSAMMKARWAARKKQ
jgi:hypothetical protein